MGQLSDVNKVKKNDPSIFQGVSRYYPLQKVPTTRKPCGSKPSCVASKGDRMSGIIDEIYQKLTLDMNAAINKETKTCIDYDAATVKDKTAIPPKLKDLMKLEKATKRTAKAKTAIFFAANAGIGEAVEDEEEIGDNENGEAEGGDNGEIEKAEGGENVETVSFEREEERMASGREIGNDALFE